jgi:3D-(3,5/4)-trihydroxycyclohexane-1,2-dione acylhydrolase (decyclizing)
MSGSAPGKSSPTLRLTMAQALVRYLAALRVDGENAPLFGGVFAIFGHGNVAGIDLHGLRDRRRAGGEARRPGA